MKRRVSHIHIKADKAVGVNKFKSIHLLKNKVTNISLSKMKLDGQADFYSFKKQF